MPDDVLPQGPSPAAGEGPTAATNGTSGPPPKQLIDYVAYRMGFAMDSFMGKVLVAVPHADQANRSRLRDAFPRIVDAWQAWQDSPDGEFEPPKHNPYHDVEPGEFTARFRHMGNWFWRADSADIEPGKSYTWLGVTPGMAVDKMFDHVIWERDRAALAEEERARAAAASEEQSDG